MRMRVIRGWELWALLFELTVLPALIGASVVCTIDWAGDRLGQMVDTSSVVVLQNVSGHGSGFVVGDRTIITAKHVAEQVGLEVLHGDGRTTLVIKVELDHDSDLAVIHTATSLGVRPLRIDRRPLRVGERITLIGTPLSKGMFNCVLQGRVVKTDYVTTTNTGVGDPTRYTNLDVLDCHGAPGTSGGPVLDTHGRVRGVLVLAAAGYVAAVPIGELN